MLAVIAFIVAALAATCVNDDLVDNRTPKVAISEGLEVPRFAVDERCTQNGALRNTDYCRGPADVIPGAVIWGVIAPVVAVAAVAIYWRWLAS